MSTRRRVRLLFAALLLASACSRRDVSYAGLDDLGELPALRIGVAVDATGPDGERGRALAAALRAELEAAGRVHGRNLVAIVVDDRGEEPPLRAAVERFEADQVRLVVGAFRPERGAALAQRAPSAVAICVACGRDGAPREASFALDPRAADAAPAELGRAAGRWIVDALRRGPAFFPREIVAALRATAPPAGHTRTEGVAAPPDPAVFRPLSRTPRK